MMKNGDSDCLKRANLWQTTMKAFFRRKNACGDSAGEKEAAILP